MGCKIVDKHLKLIAGVQQGCKFMKIDAERANFFVKKLKIRMLPTIVMFENGIASDRLVGFDEIGATDKFKTRALERRLCANAVLEESEFGEYEDDDDEEEEEEERRNVRMRSFDY